MASMSLLPVSVSEPHNDATAVTRQSPASKHSSLGSTAGTSTEGSSQKPDLRLLIVEDDEFVQMALRVMLETIADVIGSEKPPPSPARSPSSPSSMKASPSLKAIAIKLSFASSGEGGWDLLRSGEFDLALVDIHLPGVSGLDLSWCYQQLMLNGDNAINGSTGRGGGARAPPAPPLETGHQTIIIACTGDATANMEELNSYGIHDVLPKPVSTRSLRHMLHKWLPRDCQRAGQVAVTLPQPAGLQRNRSGTFAGRVLLVEDCEITRTATDLIFCQLGLHIETCETGEEAMNMLQKRDFDLLLFDMNLPTMSGYALCSWYRQYCKDERRARGCVVAITADPDPQAASEFEFDACLAKPLSTQCIVLALQDLWASRSQPASPVVSSRPGPLPAAPEALPAMWRTLLLALLLASVRTLQE